MCIHRCIIEDKVCQNKGDCLYDSRENITFCLCKEDSHNVYKGDHCEVKVEKLALQSKYIAAIAGSIGGAIVIAAITAIMCVVYRLRKKNVAEGNINHVGLKDYKECTSNKKQARSNTNWKAPVERGTNDLHPYATSTDRDTPLPRGVSVYHPTERRKARSPQSYKHGTEMEEPDKHREHYYHPYAKNTYWDALNARGSRDSHPYSSYREVRKAERTMEEHKHHVAAECIGPKRSQLKIPHGAHVHQTQPLHSADSDLYRSVNSTSHYDYIDAVSNAEV